MFFILSFISLLFPSYTFVDENIFDKDIVRKEFNKTDFMENYDKVSSEASGRFVSKGKQVLGFITPWNKDGYRLAEDFGDKFSIIVPTWFFAEIRNKQFMINGQDAVNTTWLQNMRQRHPNTVIAPRLIFQINSNIFYQENKFIFNVFRNSMNEIITKYDFDAIFLEVPSYIQDDRAQQFVPALVKEVKVSFPKTKKGKVFVDIPNIQRMYITSYVEKLIKKIADQADLVSMSCYELPQTSAVSPMSGLEIIAHFMQQKIIKKDKFLVGFPFFGFDYGNGKTREYIVGQQFVDTLNQNKVNPYFLKEYQETAYFYSKDKAAHTMYYPSLFDLNVRFERVSEYGFAGFAIWELAQGLPFFFDLL